MKKFCKRLKELREEKGLSYKELGERVQIPKSTLCRLENNQSDIKGDQVIALANFYHVSTDYILGLED